MLASSGRGSAGRQSTPDRPHFGREVSHTESVRPRLPCADRWAGPQGPERGRAADLGTAIISVQGFDLRLRGSDGFVRERDKQGWIPHRGRPTTPSRVSNRPWTWRRAWASLQGAVGSAPRDSGRSLLNRVQLETRSTGLPKPPGKKV